MISVFKKTPFNSSLNKVTKIIPEETYFLGDKTISSVTLGLKTLKVF